MADDRSLLDRLNALKPTSVSLHKEAPKLSLVAVSSEPISRDDALSLRLRTLRNASASPHSTGQESDSPPLRAPTHPKGARDTTASSLGKERSSPRMSGEQREDADGDDYDDSLFHTDDKTLDELLESLDLEDDVALDQPPLSNVDPKDESRKVAALLEQLGKPASDPSHQDTAEGNEDDSDGEEMSKKVIKVLSRALDEVELDRSLSRRAINQNEEQGTTTTSPNSRPSTQQDAHPQPSSRPEGSPFSLPTVPSQLVEPPEHPPLDFESTIAARMAALKGISYGTDPGAATFGLPQAPTFDPDSKPAAAAGPSSSATTLAGRPGGRSSGYTDEDQKTWCVVCLEDATVRCVGCDGDVYCGRCWRDMHVGPRAGYDERGHRWVRF